MFLRSTNNSLAAGLDATSLPSQSEDLPPSTSANAKVLRPSSSDAHSPLPQASRQVDVPSPAFLAWVVAAVKQALAADQTPTSVEASSSMSGGIPVTFLSSLQSQASALAVSGMGFPQVLASIAGAANQMQDRPNFVVQSFVSTFSSLAPSVAPSLLSVAAGLLPTVLSSAPNVPVLQQSFVVTLGFSPIPPKLMSQIVSGKLEELSELLKHTPTRILNCFLMGGWSSCPCLRNQCGRLKILATGWKHFQCIALCSHLSFPIDGRISSFTSC